MKIVKTEVKTVCDNGICNNFAEFTVFREDTPADMRLNICGDCARALLKELKIALGKNKNGKGV